MNRLVCTALLLSGAAISPAVSDDALEAARRAFEEARALSDQDAGRLWARPLYGPMIFIDLAGARILANQNAPDGSLTEQEGVFVGPRPESLAIANTAQRWAGTEWTTIIWPLPSWKYSRQRLIAHELFHRIQDEVGLPMRDAANPHLDERDGRAWLRLEWRALYEALMRSGDERRRAVTDALLFRAQRRTTYPDAAASERDLELNEGLAEYTGWRLCGLPAAALPARAAVRIEQEEPGDSFGRSFAYASGPAYGLLLDEATPGWHKQLNAESDLGEMLRQAYTIELPPDVRAASYDALTRYDGASVIEEEQRRHLKREERLAEWRARFIDGPVLVLPASGQVNYSFDPGRVESLPGEGQVYATLRVTDEWGTLEVGGGGALLRRTEAGAVAGFVVPAPSDASTNSISADGWTLRLNDGWRLIPGARAGDWTASRTE